MFCSGAYSFFGCLTCKKCLAGTYSLSGAYEKCLAGNYSYEGVSICNK